ncbi:hypothetical protein GG496_000186 [Candidatus Fervidibacteria bacterium JGI MDM2 JNZ-1-D12]
MGATVVLANPSPRCGVHSTAKIHAKSISAVFLTEPESAKDASILYIHWHPNFVFQHPKWTQSLNCLSDARKCFVLHDFAFAVPAKRDDDICVVFNESSRLRSSDLVIPMPLLDPYPFKPNTEGDPDKVGLFGFFGSYKGFWEVATYAIQHKKKARFITTLHPFSPPHTCAEFVEFRLFCKRRGLEVIDEWLVGQELADAMGECGFFVIPRRTGIGSSGSVTSMLATQRPVFAVKTNFLGKAAEFTMQFDFSKWPTQRELEQGMELALKAQEELAPERIFGELHELVIERLQQGG